MALPERTRIQVLALVRGRKGEYRLFATIRADGFVRVRVDGEIRDLDEEIILEKNKKPDIEIVVDRLIIKEGLETRLADSLETALKYGEGLVLIDVVDEEELLFSSTFDCPQCGFSFEELSPRMFSFNSPYGACPECSGLGFRSEIDPDRVVPDKRRSLNEGAIAPWTPGTQGYYQKMLLAVAKKAVIDLDTPFAELSQEHQDILLYGMPERVRFSHKSFGGRIREYNVRFDGVVPILARRYQESSSDLIREDIESYMSQYPCSECGGAQLKPASCRCGGRN